MHQTLNGVFARNFQADNQPYTFRCTFIPIMLKQRPADNGQRISDFRSSPQNIHHLIFFAQTCLGSASEGYSVDQMPLGSSAEPHLRTQVWFGSSAEGYFRVQMSLGSSAEGHFGGQMPLGRAFSIK